jgi:hypothetical protein
LFVLFLSGFNRSYTGADPWIQYFGVNGFTVWDNNGNTDAFYNMAQSPDGKIFLSGYTADGTNETPAIIQLDINGQLNNAFGNEGVVTIEPMSTDGETEDIAVYGENIYVAYYAEIDGEYSGAITKYDLNGNLDSTFGEAGKRTISYNAESYTREPLLLMIKKIYTFSPVLGIDLLS